ncbi:MAG: glycosyltransferase family 4 protein [Waterburya sp.]
MNRKLLIVTTISRTIRDFTIPYIRYFKQLGWQVDGMAYDISHDSECIAELDSVWEIQWSRNALDPRNFWRGVARVREVVAQENYDLVHVHTPIAAFVTRYALKDFPKTKVIYTAHGFHFYRGGNPLKNFIFLGLEKLAGKWTDYLVTINKEDENAAKKYRFLPEERIIYTPGIGLNLEQYDPRQVSEADIKAVQQELNLTTNDILFLSIAEFTPRKRQQDQLIALKKLNRPEVHIAFAGYGITQNKIERLSAKLGLQQQVHFLGHRRDIPSLICASHGVLLTSQQEGLPRCIMEAFCAAKPVIGTKIRGIQDLLVDDCGILIDVGDTNALAVAMRTIIDHPQQAAQIGQNGRQKVDSYDVQKIIKIYVDIYNCI